MIAKNLVKDAAINVLIAEDHYLVRKVTKQVVKTYYPQATFDETDSIEELAQLVKNGKYDLLILDIYLADGNVISTLPYIKQHAGPETGILFFTMCKEDTYAKRLIQLGADGFLNKKADENEIKDSLQKILAGEKYISPYMQRKLAEEVVSGRKANPFEELTNKEFEVMLYLLQGHSLNDIADITHVSVSTVSSHKKRMFDRLKITSLVELTQLTAIHNIIPGG